MKTAALVCGLFALAALAAVVKNGFQPLLGFLLLVSVVASIVFYRAKPETTDPGDTLNRTNE